MSQVKTCFQFLGIPPKGELPHTNTQVHTPGCCFQFLGIPPKGELGITLHGLWTGCGSLFPISRDPPEGGTSPHLGADEPEIRLTVSNF